MSLCVCVCAVVFSFTFSYERLKTVEKEIIVCMARTPLTTHNSLFILICMFKTFLHWSRCLWGITLSVTCFVPGIPCVQLTKLWMKMKEEKNSEQAKRLWSVKLLLLVLLLLQSSCIDGSINRARARMTVFNNIFIGRSFHMRAILSCSL